MTMQPNQFLYELFDSKMSDSSLSILLKSWIDLKIFDPCQSFGEYPSFIHAWVDNLNQGMFAKIGPKSLEVLSNFGFKDIFEKGTSKNSKRILLDIYLDKVSDWGHSSEPLPLSLIWMMEHSSPELLLKWEPLNLNHSRSNYVSFFDLVLSRGKKIESEIWLKKGWPVTYPTKNPLVRKFNHPKLWNEFLNQGGNPNLVVNGEILWEKALSIGNQTIKDSIKDWAIANKGDILKEKELDEYWQDLSRYHTIAGLKKSIRSLSDWDKIKNSKGENALMVSLNNNPAIWKDILVNKKMAKLAQEKNNKGQNLWFYLLSKGKKTDSDCFNWALKNIPPELDFQKKGWLDWIKEMPQHEAFPKGNSFCFLLKNTPQEIWLSSSLNDQKNLADYLNHEIWWGSGDKTPRPGYTPESGTHLINILGECFQQWEGVDPSLESTFAMSLLVSGGKGSLELREKAWDYLLNQSCFHLDKNKGDYGMNNFKLIDNYLKVSNSQKWEMLKSYSERKELAEKIPESIEPGTKSTFRI